jgi:protein TonB
VTRLPRETTEAPAAKATAPRVAKYDPLTPRIANSDELRLRELAMQQAAANLRNRPARSAAPSGAAPSAALAAPAGTAAPADDELGRVRVVDPVYPADAMRDRVEGWVELEFTVTETGSVRDIVVVGSQPSGVFDAAATEALSGWKYRPRIANGRPVAHRSNVTMRFDLEG